jgi:hypothetical protein
LANIDKKTCPCPCPCLCPSYSISKGLGSKALGESVRRDGVFIEAVVDGFDRKENTNDFNKIASQKPKREKSLFLVRVPPFGIPTVFD